MSDTLIKYVKANVTYTLEECVNKKKLLKPVSENIWIGHKEGEATCVLRNHAVGMYPYPSWGMVIPYNGAVNLETYWDQAEIALHPEAWNDYVNAGTITSEGEFIVPTKA